MAKVQLLNDRVLITPQQVVAVSPDCCCCDIDCGCPYPMAFRNPSEGYYTLPENLFGVATGTNWGVSGWLRFECDPATCNTLRPGVVHQGTIFELIDTDYPETEWPEIGMYIEADPGNGTVDLVGTIALREADLTYDCHHTVYPGQASFGGLTNPCDCIFFGMTYDRSNETTEEARLAVGINLMNQIMIHAPDADDACGDCAGTCCRKFRPGNVNLIMYVGRSHTNDQPGIANGGTNCSGLGHSFNPVPSGDVVPLNANLYDLTIWKEILDKGEMEELVDQFPSLAYSDCNPLGRVAGAATEDDYSWCAGEDWKQNVDTDPGCIDKTLVYNI